MQVQGIRNERKRNIMQLELAVVLSCTDAGCQTQYLAGDASIVASYSAPMREHGIVAQPGQLVAIDQSSDRPQIVYRFPQIQVQQGTNGYVLTENGRPIDPEQLCTKTFPEIRAMYERLETAQRLDPKRVVEQGYDRIAERYLEWAESDASGVRERYTSLLLTRLHPGAQVLELGCGAGVPITRALARRFEVTGVDISARQIALARQHVPQARFIQADMTELDLPLESYDGVAAFYALFHVPREQQPQLLDHIASWLRPGGLLVATMGTQASKGGVEEDWLGAPMYWSSYDSEANVRFVRKAGLDIVQAREETVKEDGEPVTFLWIVAHKPGGGIH